jgi:hypothetical protein
MKTGSIILTPELTMQHGMTSHHISKESQNSAFSQKSHGNYLMGYQEM